MKIRIMEDDGSLISQAFEYLWNGLGVPPYANIRNTIEQYINVCFRKYFRYGYHYIGDWESHDECLQFIIGIMQDEFLNIVSPLTYEGKTDTGSLFGLNGIPFPNDFASTFVSEITEDIKGLESKEKTFSKTLSKQDNETNTFEKDYDSKISYQEQNSNTKTNVDSVTSKETNSGKDTNSRTADNTNMTQEANSGNDSKTNTNEYSITSKETNSGNDNNERDETINETKTYGKKVSLDIDRWENDEGSTDGSEQLERVPVNAIMDDIKTPFSKGKQQGTFFRNKEIGGSEDTEESGQDTNVTSKENNETMTYGKIVDKTEEIDKNESENITYGKIINKTEDIEKNETDELTYGKIIDKTENINKKETENGGNNGEKTISDTHLDSETKAKNISESDDENESLSGSNDTTRDYRKSDTSKNIDDIIKSHEYLDKIRNYFYHIIFEWTSRFVDEYNTVY